MNAGRDPIREAALVQQEASRPGRSAAVCASAGSGKTTVLVGRFLRLCIEGEVNEVHPRAILAITFTRKAATEIRERLLEKARELALATDDQRRAMLARLLSDGRAPREPLPAELDRAARLYERLLEDPTGLQVGTIHAFCQRIIARFAAEAGLDPHARLVEDMADLQDEALDRLVAEEAGSPGAAQRAELLSDGEGGVRDAAGAVLKAQMRIDRWLRRLAALAGRPALPRRPLLPLALAELRLVLFGRDDLPENLSEDDLLPSLMLELAAFGSEGLDDVMARFSDDELEKLAKGIDNLQQGARNAGDAAAVRKLLLTGVKLRAFTRTRDEDLKGRFNEAVTAAAGPVLEILRRIDTIGLYRRNIEQLGLGLRALDILDELKRRDRVIDFADLEEMARRLMGDEAGALSLLFRLDDSLQHVLLDEFQDTNHNQRDILLPIIDHFLATAGAEGEPDQPTVFFVGDMKQSIYGFRGAEPDVFREMIARLGGEAMNLPTNFRSTPAVVDGVGLLFRSQPLVEALPEGEHRHVHQLAARGEPGEVVLIDAYEHDPDTGRSGAQLAAQAAARIARELVDGGGRTTDRDGKPRPLAWGDILVLARSRTHLGLYEEAFRAAGIPIEAAGRGMLAASREVQDVLALLRWLVWPDDDAALAAVLRSPIFRLPEDAFQRLLAARGVTTAGEDGRWRRPEGLWPALRREAAADPGLETVRVRLARWRGATGFRTVHDLLRLVCREGHLPARFAAALGPQAAINLERLFDLALDPEVASTPTVRRFIDVVEKAGRRGGLDEGSAADEGNRNRVQFMTVHGAKGLEKPIVLLVDADRPPLDRDAEVRLNRLSSESALVFGAVKEHRKGYVLQDDRTPALPPDNLRRASGEAAAATVREENNILYVALTRARDRLYVLGGRSNARDQENVGDLRSPLRRLQAAADDARQAPVSREDPAFLERPPEPPAPAAAAADGAAAEVHAWQPPTLVRGPQVVTPSGAAGDEEAAAAAAASQRAATVHAGAAEHGSRVHLLLQLACERGALPPGRGRAHDEAAAVVGDPRLAWVFDPASVGGRGLSEVPVVMRRGGGGGEERVTGVIDRLIIRPDRIDVIDYKTNRWGGDPERRAWLSDHYRPQLDAYAAIVSRLFPGVPVLRWLLLTDPAGRGPDETGLVALD